MLHVRNSLLCLFLFLVTGLSAQTPARDLYIQRFQKIAINEMERTGIPASIKLAQGILESGDGRSTLARKANNHFGIKCHNDWNGKGYYIEDDDYDDNGKLIKSCFRVYKNADASFIAHSEFLRDPNKRYRYGFLFNISPSDYRAWARGLKEAGYATSPTYAEKLIRIIETSELFRFDRLSSIDVDPDNIDRDIRYERLGIKFVNDVKMVEANNGETVFSIAERTNTSVKRILKYNEKLDRQTQKLEKDTRVYLQRKRKNFRGKKKYHYVKPGETLFDISQLYGIRLDKLYKKNRLPMNTEPAVGERIKIRGWFKIDKDETPQTRSDIAADDDNAFDGDEEFLDDDDTLIIEIPNSSNDNEEFDEDIVPGTPDAEIFDPFLDPEEEEEEEQPEEENQPGISEPTAPPPGTESPEVSPPVEEPTSPPQPDEEGIFYNVIKGDTLFSISRKFGTTVEGIKRRNGLTSNIISIGQRLRIF